MTISPYFMFPGAQAELIAASRAQRAANSKRRVQRDLQRALKQRHVWQFEDRHAAGRARQEIAMRNGTLRSLPSCFGALA